MQANQRRMYSAPALFLVLYRYIEGDLTRGWGGEGNLVFKKGLVVLREYLQ